MKFEREWLRIKEYNVNFHVISSLALLCAIT